MTLFEIMQTVKEPCVVHIPGREVEGYIGLMRPQRQGEIFFEEAGPYCIGFEPVWNKEPKRSDLDSNKWEIKE